MSTQTTLDCINKVQLRGSIVHKHRAEGWLVIALAVSVTPESRDFPKIYWFGEGIDQIDAEFNVGDRAEITGRLRTSKTYPATTIAGETIAPTAGWFETKVDPTIEYKQDFNEVLVRGEFIRTYKPSDGLAVITLKLINDGYTYFPQFTCFGRHAERAEKIKEGESVSLVARVQTKKRETNNDTQYYQSIVCRNIRVTK